MTISHDEVVVIGFDAGHHDRSACEHAALELADRFGHTLAVSTHVVHEPEPHYAAAIELPISECSRVDDLATDEVALLIPGRPDTGPANGLLVARAHRERQSGRLIRFGGQDALTGIVSLTDVCRLSAIDRIVCLGGDPGADAVLRTQDFVRPVFGDGVLTLAIQPFDGHDEFVPFEQPNPHPCCGHH